MKSRGAMKQITLKMNASATADGFKILAITAQGSNVERDKNMKITDDE